MASSESPSDQEADTALLARAIDNVRSSFRLLSPNDYPEVSTYSRDEIYGHGDNMAPGGLFLAAQMTRSAQLKGGDVLLDIGCGKGDSSIFLAEHFGVSVVCFDLWTSATSLSRKFKERGCRESILPLDLDATRSLPFPDDYFDAMFCMQALHSFGGDANVLRQLLRHLKPGGRLVVGGTCFNEELREGRLPDVFRETGGWNAEYEKYHSPSWWKAIFEETRLVNVIECVALPEGLIMWEDEILYHGERAGWTDEWYDKSRWLIDQLLYSRDQRPYLTHYIATVEKKNWSS